MVKGLDQGPNSGIWVATAAHLTCNKENYFNCFLDGQNFADCHFMGQKMLLTIIRSEAL